MKITQMKILAMVAAGEGALEWTARMAPCVGNQQNQSWTFDSGLLSVATATSKLCVSEVQKGDGHLQLIPCTHPAAPEQQWKLANNSRLVMGSKGCFCIRENVHSNPGVLYMQGPCRNTSNEQWNYDAALGQLKLQCSEGNCVQWQNWCLTAQQGLNPAPGPYPTPTPPPTPAIPDAPLAATEMYRTRVHTAGHFCCAGGAAYCNSTASMLQEGCSGYYDFGSPQLLLSKNGTLLSFNQGERKLHQDDNNWIDIVVRRSFDMGLTWLPLQVIHSENNWTTPQGQFQSIGQNTAVLDNITGVIHMLFTRNNTEMFATSSSDEGATWSLPETVEDKPGCPACWIAPSFSAVQLKYNQEHKGDLVACLDYSNLPGHAGGGPVERSGTMISSDHGRTWFKGATGIIGDECAIAELPNGTIVLNARNYVNQSAQTVHRSIAWSHDGGREFSPVFFPPTLPDPVVEGSMIFGDHTSPALAVGQPLFFTNPASEIARQDITLKMSQDGGATWGNVHLVQKGCGMYSSVVQFHDGSLGVQWDDAHDGPISHAGLANETFVRLELVKRGGRRYG